MSVIASRKFFSNQTKTITATRVSLGEFRFLGAGPKSVASGRLLSVFGVKTAELGAVQR
jgi:hypothetical protein